MKGIDVSKYQELIYWEKVKAAGIDFAILRAGLGKYITQIDPRFEQNAFGALGAGLHVGAYWFSYATSPEEARQEAQVCAQVLEPYKGKF
ncbi:GH25 family lysozyme, partial [Anaeromassilibacillus sp. An200]|uniref:GH25 family lysozyme n=1 Tax=Anaeromassilibacillus sp. An200 TaxID=1965587 RepID=UPI000B55DE48